jgi:arginine exporter protein ArgO
MLLGGFLAELYGVEKVFLGAGALAAFTFFFVMSYARSKKNEVVRLGVSGV